MISFYSYACSRLFLELGLVCQTGCNMIQIFEIFSCLSKQGCIMIQILESLDLVVSNMHVTWFKHVISVTGSMAHTSHLW
jgi:hypothetical protein